MLTLGKKQPWIRTGERGATLIETAIILPLVLMFIFSVIDLSRVVTRKIIISNSLRVAARYAALQSSHCDNAARTKLEEELGRFGMLDGSLVVAATRSTLNDTPTPVAVLRVTASANVSCILCPLFNQGLVFLRTDSGAFNFRSEAIVPIEQSGGCQ